MIVTADPMTPDPDERPSGTGLRAGGTIPDVCADCHGLMVGSPRFDCRNPRHVPPPSDAHAGAGGDGLREAIEAVETGPRIVECADDDCAEGRMARTMAEHQYRGSYLAYCSCPDSPRFKDHAERLRWHGRIAELHRAHVAAVLVRDGWRQEQEECCPHVCEPEYKEE